LIVSGKKTVQTVNRKLRIVAIAATKPTVTANLLSRAIVGASSPASS
jgi:hypothetical protein